MSIVLTELELATAWMIIVKAVSIVKNEGGGESGFIGKPVC